MGMLFGPRRRQECNAATLYEEIPASADDDSDHVEARVGEAERKLATQEATVRDLELEYRLTEFAERKQAHDSD